METKRRLINGVFPILLALAFLLLGCEQAVVGPEPSEAQIFTATLPGGDATKTVLSEAVNNERNVMWQENDLVRIVGATQADYRATSLSAERTSATLVPEVNGSAVSQKNASGYYEAFYPASLYRTEDGKLILPSAQSYTPVASTDGNRVVTTHLPMYARSINTNLNFQNLCSVLNFRLTGTKKVTKIEVESATRYLSGEFAISGSGTPSDGWYAAMEASGTYLSKMVMLDCNPMNVENGGVQLSSTPSEFCVALPAGEYPKDDLTVKVYSGETVIKTLTNKNVGPTGGTMLKRSEIYESNEPMDGTYVFDVTFSETSVQYVGGTFELVSSVISYNENDGIRVPLPFSFQYYDEENGSWVDGLPTWLKMDSGSDTNGSITGKTCNLVADVGATQDDAHSLILKNNPYAADEENPSKYYDLSKYDPSIGEETAARSTANCYVIRGYGKYRFPLVYGNGLLQDGENTKAYRHQRTINDSNRDRTLAQFIDHLDEPVNTPFICEQHDGKSFSAALVWMDSPGLIDTESISVIGEGRAAYMVFEVPRATIRQGNAVLALLADGVIAWSWHIWVTDADLSTGGTTVNGHQYAPVNLGWCEPVNASYASRSCILRLRQDRPGGAYAYSLQAEVTQEGFTLNAVGSNPVYQFGRKDPVQARLNTTTYALKPYYYTNPAWTCNLKVLNAEGTTLGQAIREPYNRFMRHDKTSGSLVRYWPQPGWVNLWNTNSPGVASSTTAAAFSAPVRKTIYDPSPVGFKIPPGSASNPDNAALFPALGCVALSNQYSVMSEKYYWTATMSNQNGGYNAINASVINMQYACCVRPIVDTDGL